MSLYQTQLHEQKPLTTGQITTLQIPTGQKIQSCTLYFTTAAGAAAAEADIRSELGNVRLTINGKDIVNATTIRILDMQEALGTRVGTAAGIAGAVELNLGRLLFVDPVARDFVGWGTADVSSIQVQITAGTLVNVANVQAITQRSPVSEVFQNYCKFISYPQSFNSTGDHTVDTLPRDLDSSYLAVQIDDGASGTITNGEVRVNGVTITEKLPANANAQFNSNKGYQAVSGYYNHFFTDGTISARLPMPGVTDLRFIQTFSVAPGAASYTVTPLTLITPYKA